MLAASVAMQLHHPRSQK